MLYKEKRGYWGCESKERKGCNREKETIMAEKVNPFKLLRSGLLQGENRRHIFVVATAFVLLISISGLSIAKDISPDSSCRKLRSMARVYVSCGEYTKALPLAKKALYQAETIDGVSDSELSSCLIDLAWVYKSKMQFERARQACERGLELQKAAYYENHPYVAYTLRILSSIYQGQGKYQEAEDSLNQAMAIMLENHSVDDRVIAPFKVGIGKLLVAEGNFAKAETYYLSALDLINKSYGTDHLYTAGVNGYLAKLYVLQGKYRKAEPLIKQTLAIQKKVYGPNHHLIAPTWLTLAKIYQAKGNYVKAETLYNQALATLEKTFTPEHFCVADVLDAQAQLYKEIGNLTKAAQARKRSEQIRAMNQTKHTLIAKAG
jgi:tetratricopeptide (TPR) repeat protein